MLADPSTKYLPYTDVPFPPGYVRQWPTRKTRSPPRWLSTDLRDGNQALVNPMSNSAKIELFRLLVKIGFKEIEVAYPSAAEIEYQFVRSLIDDGEVPDDVSLQIITPARPDLITKSIQSLSGARHAIIHLYNAVSPVFREVVFRNSREQTINLTLDAVRLVKRLTEEETARSGTRFTLNYCLETFSQTEPEFAVELANRVLAEWGKAIPEDPIIFNLAATVECAPSNQYADLVEYFDTNINDRESVVLSIHPHNDRGTAIAAAENGVLAGGQRIEGCLLGNGERTGNVDLITLALNLYSQGISPALDFSNLPEVVRVVSKCNEMTVPARYPYAGALVFSAFAGTHQDAIKKGLDAQAKRWDTVDKSGEGIKSWLMPYIPVDPKDLGYGYENLIRVSSQSGKAGTAYVIRQTMGLDLPRQLQVAFYGVVQRESERLGKEMTTILVTDAFKKTYCVGRNPMGRVFLQSVSIQTVTPSSSEPDSDIGTPLSHNDVKFSGEVVIDGAKPRNIEGDGKTVVAALLDAIRTKLNIAFTIHDSDVFTSMTTDSKTATFVFVKEHNVWGVGISSDKGTSRCRAVVSAVNGFIGDKTISMPKLAFKRRPRMPSRQSSDASLKDLRLRAGRAPTPTSERKGHSSYPAVETR